MKQKVFLMLALLLMAATGVTAQSTYTVQFKANNNTKTVENVTLPHTFWCNHNGDGELDQIIQQLYGLLYGNCDSDAPIVSGSKNVTAGYDSPNQYITISAPFEGTTTVSGSYWMNDVPTAYSLEISIPSYGKVNVTSVSLSQTEATMTVGGETLTLTATVAPNDATDQTVTWTTSDPAVATVANGVVTAVAAGTATITATATNGTDDTSDDKSATCTVTVAPTYKIAMKKGTEDAANWAANPNPAEENQTVTLKYDGVMKVKSVKARKKATAPSLAEATAADLGKIVGADGNIYDTKAAAETAGTTAVAMIAYVGNETDHGTYTHGLAIGLNLEKLNGQWDLQWDTAKSVCEGKTAVPGAAWLLPSENQWRAMFKAFGNNESSKSGLNTALSNAGAVTQTVTVWTSVESGNEAKYMAEEDNIMVFEYERKDHAYYTRSCLVF